jgi:hypothetical protein
MQVVVTEVCASLTFSEADEVAANPLTTKKLNRTVKLPITAPSSADILNDRRHGLTQQPSCEARGSDEGHVSSNRNPSSLTLTLILGNSAPTPTRRGSLSDRSVFDRDQCFFVLTIPILFYCCDKTPPKRLLLRSFFLRNFFGDFYFALLAVFFSSLAA